MPLKKGDEARDEKKEGGREEAGAAADFSHKVKREMSRRTSS